jgi:hypothetical protein
MLTGCSDGAYMCFTDCNRADWKCSGWTRHTPYGERYYEACVHWAGVWRGGAAGNLSRAGRLCSESRYDAFL